MLQISCNGYNLSKKKKKFLRWLYLEVDPFYKSVLSLHEDLYFKEAYHSTQNPHLVNSLAKQEHHRSQTIAREGG